MWFVAFVLLAFLLFYNVIQKQIKALKAELTKLENRHNALENKVGRKPAPPSPAPFSPTPSANQTSGAQTSGSQTGGSQTGGSQTGTSSSSTSPSPTSNSGSPSTTSSSPSSPSSSSSPTTTDSSEKNVLSPGLRKPVRRVSDNGPLLTVTDSKSVVNSLPLSGEVQIGGMLPGLGTVGASVKVKKSAPLTPGAGHRRTRSNDRDDHLPVMDNGAEEPHSDSETRSSGRIRKTSSSATPSASPSGTNGPISPPLTPTAPIVKMGDLHFGTKLVGKRRWHRRSFVLFKDGWLAFKEKNGTAPVAWIYIPRCLVFLKERIIRLQSFQLFYPPLQGGKISKKFGSTRCMLRCSDTVSAEEWMREFSSFKSELADTALAAPLDLDDDDDDFFDEESERSELPDPPSRVALIPVSHPTFYEEPDDTSSSSSSSSLTTAATTAESLPSSDSTSSIENVTSSSSSTSTSSSSSSSSTATPSSSGRIPASQSETGLVSTGRPELRRQESLRIEAPDAPPTEVPLTEASAEKQGLFDMLKKMVGSDLTTISMPISVHEPTGFLQRMAEGLQYHHLLEEAGNTDDPIRQMTLTAAFAIVAYSCNDRLGKPFNPYLGETYQYEEGNVRFFAEQVSHHPPIGACVLEGPNFVFWQDMCVQTKFGGNNLDVTPTGEWHVKFKRNGNHIWWNGVKTVVYQIIIGSMWIDCFGETELVSTRGEKAKVKMNKCGWTNKSRWICSASTRNAQGKEVESFSGKWNSELKMDKTGEVIWRNNLGTPRPGDKYKRPEHVFDLIASPPALLERLPPTDTRFRKDLVALQANDSNRASAEKKALEERERALRRERAAQGIEYRPRWFAQGVHPESLTGSPMWLYAGEYWQGYGSPEVNSRLGPGQSLLD